MDSYADDASNSTRSDERYSLAVDLAAKDTALQLRRGDTTIRLAVAQVQLRGRGASRLQWACLMGVPMRLGDDNEYVRGDGSFVWNDEARPC